MELFLIPLYMCIVTLKPFHSILFYSDPGPKHKYLDLIQDIEKPLMF